MALRRPPTTFSDDITAGDLAANSVGASELADNAVDEAAIAANAVTTAKIADSSSTTTGITPAKIAENAVTSAKIATGAVIADGIGAGAVVEAGLGAGAVTSTKIANNTIEVKPHIIPGRLYPAYKGKLSDGVTAHSGNYGTAQSDGFSYYYTDINGSKPINDPRIGAHFGSQRHIFSSAQFREQETAVHGSNVYSIDGRENMRCVAASPFSGIVPQNNTHSAAYIQNGYTDAEFYEVTGYFNDINMYGLTWPSSGYALKYSINGASYTTASNSFNVTLASPLIDRYIRSGSLLNLPVSATLGINTVKISMGGAAMGIELIAQDTQDFTATNATNTLTSVGHTLSNGDQIRLIGGSLPGGLSATTTYFVIGVSGNNFQVSATFGGSAVAISSDGSGSRTFRSLNTIQIPSQTVVSYGKKFSVSATTQHYNPFATKGDGSVSTIPSNTTGDSVGTGWAGSTSAYWDSSLDTATSLGLAAWVDSGNYYRPVNGGRVVKWIDSSGNIKTSVNMMPPEAHAHAAGVNQIGIATGSCAATGTHNWTSQPLPQFGNRTIGSNLMAAMTDNGSYPFETRPGGGLNGAWNNTTGYGLAYLAVSLTIGKLYRIRYDASGVSGVTSYIGTANGTAASNWKNKRVIANGTNRTSVFRADALTTYIVMHTGNGAAAFTIANFTLYELEEPESQAEVAKTFHFREFGNGSANGGSAGATYADASMLAADDDVTYVMDDGLTSHSGENVTTGSPATGVALKDRLYHGSGDYSYITFIGTGITFDGTNWADNAMITHQVAQNLPYGTHTLKVFQNSGDVEFHVDGVMIYDHTNGPGHTISEITFHQPKKPPIPENAVIIADYMLMADFVAATSAGRDKVSKGIRRVDCSRDVFYNSGTTGNRALQWMASADNILSVNGTRIPQGDTSAVSELPAFCTNQIQYGYNTEARYQSWSHDASGSYVVESSLTKVGTSSASFYRPTNSHTLGLVKHKTHGAAAASSAYVEAVDVVSPIHTSSHYQPFETPLAYELVGGDRNMEQTNLVVTADGKTWDEVTRDTSYIGNMCVHAFTDTNTAWGDYIKMDEWRGSGSGGTVAMRNKDFAIADAGGRVICLVDGVYDLYLQCRLTGDADTMIYCNGVNTVAVWTQLSGTSGTINLQNTLHIRKELKRGDYITYRGEFGHSSIIYDFLQIHRAGK